MDEWPGTVRLVEVAEGELGDGERARWRSVVTHTHNLRTGRVGFEASKDRLLAWAERHGLDAVGVGSPWEPISRAHYLEHEGPRRDAYYAGRVDPESVMDRGPIAALFDDLNGRSSGTFFYQDNETPKNRYGHVWYFGYVYDVPAWHDYSQDRPVKHFEADPHVELNTLTGEPHWRRSSLEVASEQRAQGAVAVWAHPTSWWRSGERFVTNIAAESLLHLVADGGLDGLAVMGYGAHRPSYQALWFHYLDTGAVVPGFAETDYAFDDRDIPDQVLATYVDAPSTDDLARAMRTRPHFAGTGVIASVSVDGVPMGRVVETAAGRVHEVTVEAYPAPGQARLGRVELVGRGGEVLHALDGFAGGVARFELRGADAPGYVVVRAFGEGDDPEGPAGDVRHLGLSDPVYLHPAGFRVEPVTTDMTLAIGADSPWLGGEIAIEAADGRVIERARVEPGEVRREVPANARVRLTKDGRAERLFYIAVENESAQELLRYLYDGEFLADYPDTVPGEVPAEAFRIDEMREALRAFRFAL